MFPNGFFIYSCAFLKLYHLPSKVFYYYYERLHESLEKPYNFLLNREVLKNLETIVWILIMQLILILKIILILIYYFRLTYFPLWWKLLFCKEMHPEEGMLKFACKAWNSTRERILAYTMLYIFQRKWFNTFEKGIYMTN